VHDVAIAGAGPAGVAAAIHLVRAGQRVVLLERDVMPRPKACGEGLFATGVNELRALGIDAGCLGGRPLARIRFHAGGHTAEAPALGAVSVERADLAAALLAVARAGGVDLRAGGEAVQGLTNSAGRAVAFRTSRGPVEARAFVAADGLNSRLRRAAGLDGGRHSRRWGVSTHIRLAADAGDAIEVFFEDGYELYVTPLAGCRANLALLGGRAAMARFAGRRAAAFAALIAEHPALAAREARIDDRVLAAGPFGRKARRAWRANLVLAGDAAGFADGISGEGMSAALASGRLAATAVTRLLAGEGRAPLRDYEQARRSLVRNSNLLAGLALALAANPRLAALAVRNLERRPVTFARLVAINAGSEPLAALRPRDLLALSAGL
jgi:flavin-dependent dehydrogenase